MAMESRLEELVSENLDLSGKRPARIVLAFSGGLDSSVLLYILVSIRCNSELLVWHINHGLLDCAGEMEGFCRRIADQYKVEFKVSHLNLDRNQSNLEAFARQARYAAFEQFLNETDILLTAHHADDQAETLFLNLLRGSGSAGLRGIARNKTLSKTLVSRPLLDISRDTLKEYAKQQSIKWFDDPSNLTERFDRNFLRQQVLPKLKSRWPGYLQSIRRVCHIQSETQQLLDEIGESDYQYCQLDTFRLCQRRLVELSTARQKNVIRYWLRDSQFKSLPVGRLETLIKQLGACQQAQPRIEAIGYDIRIYRGELFIVKKTEHEQAGLLSSYSLNSSNALQIKSIGLETTRADVFNRLKIEDNGQSLSLCFRGDGIPPNQAKHRLKRLFQAYHVPPWLRGQTPQIYIDGELKDLLIENFK